MKTLKTTALIALMLAGCNKETPPAQMQPQPYMEPTHPDVWSPAGKDPHGNGSLDPVVHAEGKIARRLTVDQLRRSIPALFDGITWTVPVGRGQQPGFTVLSRTLGEADYIQATMNNLDATPLFAKFMDDMAGDVCSKAVDHDRATAVAAERVLMRLGEVDANLRWLKLKLHGLLVPEGSMDGIEDLRALFDDVVAETESADDGWYAVCIAMLTAPEMMAY